MPWKERLLPSWHFPPGPRCERRTVSRPSQHSRRQVVVKEPLEGGRIGLNLSEDDLVVNNFGDQRAEDFGFRIGDRIIQAIHSFYDSLICIKKGNQ